MKPIISLWNYHSIFTHPVLAQSESCTVHDYTFSHRLEADVISNRMSWVYVRLIYIRDSKIFLLLQVEMGCHQV